MDIRNFCPVNALLTTSGQPTEEHLRALAAQGYKAIVNLGLYGQPYSLLDEAGSVRALHMDYFHVPVVFDQPKLSDLEAFIAVMKQLAGQKTHVHCAANYRAITFTALYLFSEKKLDQKGLEDFIGQVWQPDHNWQLFLDEAMPFLERM